MNDEGPVRAIRRLHSINFADARVSRLDLLLGSVPRAPSLRVWFVDGTLLDEAGRAIASIEFVRCAKFACGLDLESTAIFSHDLAELSCEPVGAQAGVNGGEAKTRREHEFRLRFADPSGSLVMFVAADLKITLARHE